MYQIQFSLKRFKSVSMESYLLQNRKVEIISNPLPNFCILYFESKTSLHSRNPILEHKVFVVRRDSTSLPTILRHGHSTWNFHHYFTRNMSCQNLSTLQQPSSQFFSKETLPEQGNTILSSVPTRSRKLAGSRESSFINYAPGSYSNRRSARLCEPGSQRY